MTSRKTIKSVASIPSPDPSALLYDEVYLGLILVKIVEEGSVRALKRSDIETDLAAKRDDVLLGFKVVAFEFGPELRRGTS